MPFLGLDSWRESELRGRLAGLADAPDLISYTPHTQDYAVFASPISPSLCWDNGR